MPREDIGDRVTSALIAELGDKNWKVSEAGVGSLQGGAIQMSS